MPNAEPPRHLYPTPHFHLLKAGERLWRVHRRCHDALSVNPDPSDPNFGGGRFDGTERDPFSVYYAALEARTALAESLLRDVPFNEKGYRTIPRAAIRGRRASVVETTETLRLVDLCSGEALAAIAQDTWLVQAEPDEYHATRRWASWIRERVPTAQGLIWPSKREGSRPAIALFPDRCPGGSLVDDPGSGQDLDDLEGAVWINEQLRFHKSRVARPRRV